MPVMIRPAVLADIPELVRLGRAFYDGSKMQQYCGFDENTLRLTLNHLIISQASGATLLLVNDHVPDVLQAGAHYPAKLGGMLALMAFPGYFDTHSRMVQELFWWAEDGHGLDLITRAKLWVASTGGGAMMIAETGPGNVRNSRVYQRMGFEPVERFYMQFVAHETSTPGN